MLLRNQLLLILTVLSALSCGSSASIKEESKIEPGSFLINVGRSGRISSNHYADVVLDSKGNAYIASFVTEKDNNDYINIVKVKPNGETGWTIGKASKGRATSIAINEKDEIYVTGFFSGSLRCGKTVLMALAPENMFIVKLNPQGECLWAMASVYESKAFDINVNTKGEILIAGVLAEKERFGDLLVERQTDHEQFLAKIDSSGTCLWVKQFNGRVRNIKSKKDLFYVCGGFSKYLFSTNDSVTTTNAFDYDGFVMQIGDSINWVKTTGRKGVIQHGYRTHDVVADIDISMDGKVWAVVTKEYPAVKGSSTSFIKGEVYSYNQQGTILDSLNLFSSVTRDSPAQILATDSTLVVTGAKYNLEGVKVASRPFIQHFTRQGDLLSSAAFDNNTECSVRAVYSNKTATVFTGHFRETMTLDSMQIANATSGHALFLYYQK